MARLNYSVDKNDLKIKWGYRVPKLFALVDEFIASDAPIAEVKFEEGEYKNASSFASTVATSMTKRHITNVGVMVRGNKAFLYRKDKDNG